MSFLVLVLLLAMAIWWFGWWLGRGEDHSVHDHPVDPAAWERFGHDSGPSAAHREAENLIRSNGVRMQGKARRELVRLSREFMEEFPQGRDFQCEFRPVEVCAMKAEWVLAPGADPARRICYIHGGAFIAGSPNSHRTITSRFSEVARAAVLAIDYRLMPEHPRQAGIEDCRQAYAWVLENGPDGPGKPERLYVSGDSAGGNLSLMISNWARDQHLRKPDGVIALSPLTDSLYSSPSMRENVLTDIMLGPLFGQMMRIPKPLLNLAYTVENRYRPIHPDVSPLRADLSGLPPTLIHASEAEMLFDDARRYVNKARASGSPARLQSWAGLMHVWQIFNPEVPEAMQAFGQIGAFVREVEAAA